MFLVAVAGESVLRSYGQNLSETGLVNCGGDFGDLMLKLRWD